VLHGTAFAQSAALIEAVRVHQPKVAAMAHDELEACKAPSCHDADRLALLTAVLTLSDGDAELATTLLTAHKAPRGLEAFHDWYLGEAQSWVGRRAKAIGSLTRARKSAPAWLQKKIDLRIAELQLDLGQASKASAAIEAAAAADPSVELLLDRALCRRALKDLEGSNADLRVLALKYPTHPHGKTALAMLELDKPVAWTADERLARAQATLAAGDAAGTLTQLDEVTSAGLAQRVALLKGQALLARGKDAEALTELERAAAGASSSVAAEALMAQARRLMRLARNTEARAAFHALELKYPKDVNADEAGYLNAWLAMNGGTDEVAVTDFAAFENNHPGSKRRDEARWFRGFSLYRLGRAAEARATLTSLVADFPKSQLLPQALYWATRSAQLRPAATDAGAELVDVSKEYRDLISSFGGTFYARLAIERLRELGAEPPNPFPARPRSMVVKMPAALALAAELSKAGLLRDQWEEVQRVVGSVGGVEQALTYGHALQALGEYGAAHALAARYLWGSVYTLHQPDALGLMYPQAWRGSVESSAEQSHVDPFFAWAIMRRESAFRPEVTSFADARGLMQLIPPTAKQIGLEIKHPLADADELYAPETNVRLGCAYLSALFDRLEHPGLVAAAYNGGPSAVVKWAQSRGAEPFDQWVEEIPFKETRGYVKQVVADVFIYRQLYGEPGGTGTLSLVIPSPKQKGVDY
jgi:soluble lytic murein transglycosylase